MKTLSMQQALLLLTLSGCGIGTEVGNGVKSPSGGNGGTSKSPSSSPGSASGGTPATPAQQNDTTAQAGTASGPVPADSDVLTPNFDFDVRVLGAACASPFAQSLAAPLNLAAIAASGTLSDQLNIALDSVDTAEERWDVANSSNTLLYKISKDTSATMQAGSATAPVPNPLAVKMTDPHDAPVPTATQCMTPVVTPGVQVSGMTGTYTRTVTTVSEVATTASATVTTTRLAWYTLAGVGAEKLSLVRVEIGGTDAAPAVILLAVPPPVTP